ncbi:MAG: hypothetical protein Q8S73_11550 [Deltaproteobacteria bacterium]|nr:hypothetical protein [Myxococcales bacterium]MDP3214732.1 hypothetical protein [Deltaproteobacteria bacterium]
MVVQRSLLRRVAVTCALLLLAPATAAAQDRFNTRIGRVTNGLYMRNSTIARVNPLGFFNDFRLGYRHRIFDRPDLPLIQRNTYWAAAASAALSPAFIRAGAAVEFAPLAVLNLSASFERVQWFGTFNYVASYGSANENFSDSAIRERARTEDPAAAGGWVLTLQGILQAKVGDLAIRNTTRGVWNSLSLPSARPVFYDIFYDTMAPNGGWTITDDVDLIYQNTEMGFNVGLRFSAVLPLFPTAAWGADGAALPGAGALNTPITRLGPLVSYTFREGRHSFFNAPTVFVLAQWWLTHRYRTGGCDECISQGLPMIAIGFAFRGDS